MEEDFNERIKKAEEILNESGGRSEINFLEFRLLKEEKVKKLSSLHVTYQMPLIIVTSLWFLPAIGVTFLVAWIINNFILV